MISKKILQFIAFLLVLPIISMAQVTNGSISGTVKDYKGAVLVGASVEAVHEPSGSKYKTVSSESGKFNLPGLRIGGPYKVTVSYVGFKSEVVSDIFIQLGDPTVLEIGLVDSKTNQLQDVTVSGAIRKGALISKDRKGAGTNINKRLLSSLPTLSRSVTDFTKLTPQANGTSFAGQDNRAINFTLDGSIFNNSFGLNNLPGGQTNSTPISLDAIEEIQVNISPYNLKEAGFTGASINAVTKSGTNTVHGTGFYNLRNESYVGKKAGLDGKEDVITNAFDVKQFGASLGGAFIKNKLFYFVSYEGERRNDPGTNAIPDNGSNTGQSNVNRVKQSELDGLSDFLKSKFNYDPGTYVGYKLVTKSDKFLARIDWNINDVHKLSIRGNTLRSVRDVPISSSGSFTSRANLNNNQSMVFSNTAYEIHNDINSVIAQLNSRFSSKINNELTFGYTANRDYRAYKGSAFPTIDINDGAARTYITFGPDPFTPNNTLNTDTWQLSDNLTIYKGKHTISTGFNFESFKFFNQFTPNIFGTYTFKTLADFYTSANAYLANPNMSTNPVNLDRYQWSASNTGEPTWYATTKARSLGFYIQDDIDLQKNFSLTYGVRFDIPYFSGSGYTNAEVDGMNFVNEKGVATKLSTSKLPTAKLMINPRIGFNYDVKSDKTLQIRGGVGLFTGRPSFVFISNQIGNNGVQSGSGSVNNTNIFPFKPTTPASVPTSVFTPNPGVPAAAYNIATTESDFRFPQVLRANLAVDHKIYNDIVASAEFIFTQSISNIYYYNANLKPAATTFNGPDNRPRFAGVGLSGTAQNNAIRINPKISDATVMKSGPYGGSITATFKLEKPVRAKGLGWMIAYNYGSAKDYINPGSIAFSSWSGNRSVNGNNRPDLSFSDYDQRNRVIGNINYRTPVGKNAAFQVSLFGESRNQGRFSYTYSGDMNGDGINGNDLLYIPKDQTEMNFIANGAITAQQQKDAFEAYINQDSYLSSRRGMYAERNGGILPMVTRFDLSTMFEISTGGKNKQTVQIRADIFNIGNLINNKWGVGYNLNNTTLLAARGVNASGVPVYTMNTYLGSLNYATTRKGTSLTDVWQAQFGIRYIF